MRGAWGSKSVWGGGGGGLPGARNGRRQGKRQQGLQVVVEQLRQRLLRGPLAWRQLQGYLQALPVHVHPVLRQAPQSEALQAARCHREADGQGDTSTADEPPRYLLVPAARRAGSPREAVSSV